MAGITGLTGWVGIVLNAPDARALAYFYRDLFGWPLADDEPDWCTIRVPGAPANLAFQTEDLRTAHLAGDLRQAADDAPSGHRCQRPCRRGRGRGRARRWPTQSSTSRRRARPTRPCRSPVLPLHRPRLGSIHCRRPIRFGTGSPPTGLMRRPPPLTFRIWSSSGSGPQGHGPRLSRRGSRLGPASPRGEGTHGCPEPRDPEAAPVAAAPAGLDAPEARCPHSCGS